MKMTSIISIALFAIFAFGLWRCGVCSITGADQASDQFLLWFLLHENGRKQSGGVVALAQAQRRLRKQQASPAELGEGLYIGCIACHGPNGGGGVGPQLAGQSADAILGKLQSYGKGETLGPQSALMWSQAAQLSDNDMENICCVRRQRFNRPERKASETATAITKPVARLSAET